MKPYSGGIRHDYKDSQNPDSTSGSRRWSWFAVGLLLPISTVTLLLVSEPNESKVPSPARVESAATAIEPVLAIGPIDGVAPPALPEPAPLAATVEPNAAAPIDAAVDAPAESAIAPDSAILDLLVNRGDTLEILFRRNGLNLADLAAMVALPDAAEPLRKIRPGDEIEVTHRDGHVLSLQRELNDIDLLTITRGDSGFVVSKEQREMDVRTVGAHGVIDSSLFEAAVAAGIADAVTMNMAGIFQWDIDFIQDVREGDQFTVIYEELWRDGVKLRNGDIVAAEFVNQGKRYRAARYTDAKGRSDYYTPEGRSVRKAFIRAPVSFTRISSNFNPNRRHPVLNTIRAHRGVDYAAPTGTPVKAAGDGKVIFRGVQGGYGNVVILQHGGNITTLYGHLSKFAKPRIGSRVKQGEIIGYVGHSGLATGPHLHYEYRINGVHRNPRTVALPDAEPVPAQFQDDFKSTTATLWQQLDLYDETRFAATGD